LWKRLATSELLSTFFPTWIWQGREWAKGRIPKYDPYYWGNSHTHPVLSTYYPFQLIQPIAFSLKLGYNASFKAFLGVLFIHVAFGFVGWYFLLQKSYEPMLSLFGAITLTFGAVSLRQQPCILYTLAWFPWTLHQDPLISAIAFGMMILAGYYPFSIYLLPIAVMAHILWYSEAWVLCGLFLGLPQLVPFLKHLPNTVKRVDDKCESPAVERRFYVGIIPIMLLPFATSRIWPLTVLSALFSLGLCKGYFPRVHERWLVVLQFCIGWMAVNSLNNLKLNTAQLILLTGLHIFDIFWHNRECLPPRPYCELWQRPSRVFNTNLTRYLESNLGDYKVSGLPWPLFTGHINGLRTIGYCGSMQTKDMWEWRKSFRHDPFIDGVNPDDLTKHRIKYSYSRKKPDKWHPTPIRHLYRNPNL